ncbi:MAG: MBL fold metallo-hydrolase, partial [Fulvivirga sp.]|nr:MBL fold metallo-hydrolase [Fulvivirga sp.]
MAVLSIILKILKMIVYTILGLVALIALAGLLFINLSPEFGGEPTVSQKQIYKESPQYKNGKFHNAIPTPMKMGPKKMLQVMFEFWKGAPGREPESPLPMQKVDPEVITTKSDTLTRLTWFGHSAFLLEIAGKNILIDPMFGETPAPIPLLGPQRFNQELPIAVDQLPAIDAVIFSHDHYDHLDYGTIQKLKDKVGQFYMPLGVGAHL